jgi:hypothetical protein
MATETDAAVMSIALAICDEFIDAGLLNRESVAKAFAAHAWTLQQQRLPIAAGILEVLRQALTDDEKRAFRKKLKEQIADQPPGTVQ